MTSHQLYAVASLKCGYDPAVVEEVFTATAETILGALAGGDHVVARPLAIFHPAKPTGRPGATRYFDVKPYPKPKKKEVCKNA